MEYAEKIREQALGMLAQGLTPREVSIRMGGRPCVDTIRLWARALREPDAAAGTSRARKVRTTFPLAVKVDAIRQIGRGRAVWDVAAEVGADVSTVRRWIHVQRERGVGALVTQADMDMLAGSAHGRA